MPPDDYPPTPRGRFELRLIVDAPARLWAAIGALLAFIWHHVL